MKEKIDQHQAPAPTEGDVSSAITDSVFKYSSLSYLEQASYQESLDATDNAIALCQRSIAAGDQLPEAYIMLAKLLRRKGRTTEAIAALHELLRLCPESADAHNRMGFTLALEGKLEEAIPWYYRAVAIDPGSASFHSQLLYILHHQTRASPSFLLDEAKRWAHKHSQNTFQDYGNDQNTSRPLRVGYISPDFRRHTIARLIAPILHYHDSSRFQVFCYSAVEREDSTTRRLRNLVRNWRTITTISAVDASRMIREDQIDVLVDLSGHMIGNRMDVFALKPAPVQVQIGYAGTTGLGTIDYRISDEHSDPLGASEANYTEELLRLPACAWLYEPDIESPAPSPLPVLTNEVFTFGCLNRPIKITDEAVLLWSKILNSVPRSRLLLSSGPSGAAAGSLGDRFRQLGIYGDQLEIVPALPRINYLDTFNRIDLSLDPFPYNGDTTTCDSFWMGVPVICLAGNSFHSRRGISHCMNVGLSEMIAIDPANYLYKAIFFANKLDFLAKMRCQLRQRLLNSSLTDAPTYVSRLESLYREIWAKWVGGSIS